jgi:DNA-directed RNA polymerase specialized sigma24 family protein
MATGEWLPEPEPAATHWTSQALPVNGVDPADGVSLDESLSMALLLVLVLVLVLESMAPAERVAFVLHDVFGYPFAEVGEIVGRSPNTCSAFTDCNRDSRSR